MYCEHDHAHASPNAAVLVDQGTAGGYMYMRVHVSTKAGMEHEQSWRLENIQTCTCLS